MTTTVIPASDAVSRVIKKKAAKKKATKKAAKVKTAKKPRPDKSATDSVAVTVFDYNAIDSATANKLKQYEDGVVKTRMEGSVALLKMGEHLSKAHELCKAKSAEHPSGAKGPYNFSLWCEQRLNISKRSAYRSIEAFKRFGDRLETAKQMTPTAIYAICAAPDP